MKVHELRELSQEELVSRLNDEKTALTNMRFNKAIAGQLENPARLRTTRRMIARINMIMNEKQSAD